MAGVTRREVLAPVVAAGSLAIAGTTPTRAASTTDTLDARQPSHVTLSFDRTTLKRFRPLLVTTHLDIQPQGLWAMTAESDLHDSRVHVYAAQYTEQNSAGEPLGFLLPDAHFGDHEWFYVLEESGTIQEVVFSAYHWIAGGSVAPAVPLYEDADGPHPKAHVVKPWHQYYLTEREGVFVNLYDLTAVFDDWLQLGMDEDLHPGAVANPWTMLTRDGGQDRGYWWRDTVGGYSYDATLAKTAMSLGVGGSGQADTTTGGS